MKRTILRLVGVATVFSAACFVFAQGARPAPPAQISDEIITQRVVRGNTEFALDLYAKLSGEKGNVFLSPYSVSSALGMTWAGARGDTADRMAKTLHFSHDSLSIHQALGRLTSDLNEVGSQKGCRVAIANRLFGDKGQEFLPEFLAIAQKFYGGGLEQVGFAKDPDAARKTINTWVEKRTEDKIKDLLLPPDVTRDTRLVLVNAIYFKGDWEAKFDKKLTVKEKFHQSALPIAERYAFVVPMMKRTGPTRFFRGKNFSVVELPYVGKRLSMVICLPDGIEGLPAFEKTLTADTLAEWIGSLQESRVEVTLPKFTITRRYGDMEKTLADMGLPLNGDFSGMTGKNDLFISKVVHKAFVDVNEEGTEAAAATGVVVDRGDAPTYVEFRADHPFFFLIRDRETGSILFMGRLFDPTRGEVDTPPAPPLPPRIPMDPNKAVGG